MHGGDRGGAIPRERGIADIGLAVGSNESARRVLLFDIDGTLVRSLPGRGYRREVRAALEATFGTAGRIDEVRFDGNTDLSILREALEAEGIPFSEIRLKLADWEQTFVGLTRRALAEAPVFASCPGTERLLEMLSADPRFDLSVLTGNLEHMAGVKLESVGFDRHFRLRGAYGSDHEDRNELPAIAIERISGQTGRQIVASDCVIIGDTPRDIEAARANGMKCVAVATGPHALESLGQYSPDVLVQDLCDGEALIEALLG